MELSNDLLSQFAKVTNDKKETKKESTVYGTVTSLDGQKYVMMDGSELATPCDTTMDVGVGDRVVVQIKNHTATITGNMSSPAVKEDSVSGIVQNEVSDKFDTLEAGYAEIDNLKAGYAEIDTLKAGYAEIDTLKAGYAEIDTLKAGYADITDLKADFADIKTLTVDELAAKYAFIQELDAKEIDTESIDADFANIVFANVEEAHIDNLFAKYGMIEVVDGVDGTFTRNLIGVNVIGDTIQANNLVVKGENGIYYKLNIDHMGKATADELTEEEKEKLKNGLLGDVIVAHSITADKISVTDLKAFGATIGGFTITDDAIHTNAKGSVDATTHGIYLDNDGQMAIGNNADQYIRYSKQDDGSYKLDIEADSILIKTADKDVDISEFGTRLDIAETTIAQNADEISLKASKTYVGDAIKNIDIGGRNYLVNTSNEWSDDITVTGWQYYVDQNKFITVSTQAFEELIGKEVTFSGYICNKSGSEVGIMMHVVSPDAANGYRQITSTMKVTAGNTDLISYTFTMPAEIKTITGVRFAVRHSARDVEDSIVNIKGWKLEVGNKATDWSPAPEDYYTKAQTLAEIKVEADKITSSVSGTYATKGEVKDVESLVEQTAESITSTVSANYPTKDDVASQIRQTAEDITSTVSQSYATKGDIADVESQIQQTVEGITATVSTEVKTAVDGIEIGGRNLVMAPDGLLGEPGVIRIAQGAYQLFNLTDYGKEHIKNKKVTASFEAIIVSDTITTANIDCYLRISTSVDRKYIDITNKWQKYSATLDASKAGEDTILTFAIRNSGTGNPNIEVRNVKVEIGDKATDWSLAPEQMASKAELTQTQAELKILSDSITSTVSRTTALEEGLEAAESQITQTANSITSTVESAVTGLTIGGRNLVLDSESTKSIQNTYKLFNLTDYGIQNVKNKKVTASFDAMTSGSGIVIDCYLRYVNASNQGVSVDKKLDIEVSSGKWTRRSVTLDASKAGDNTITSFAIHCGDAVSVVGIRNVKVEIGDKATDWSPAPEEMASKTELTQTNTDLTLKINNNATAAANASTAAAKTATNYLNASTSGLVVGNHTTGTLGNNVLIGSDHVSIRNGTTVNSKFTGDSIELGRNSKTATADILGGAFKIKYTTEIDTGGFGVYGKKGNYERLAFQPINENGNLTLGYGSYAAAVVNTSGDKESVGASGTNIWGNRIYLRSADDIYVIPRYNRSGQTGRSVILTGHLKVDEGYSVVTDNIHGTDEYQMTLGVSNNLHMIQLYQAGGANSGNYWFRPGGKDLTDENTKYDNKILLGTSGHKWKEIWSNNALNTTSDRNVKQDITSMDERYEQLFNLLKPVKYKFIDGDSGRTHTGFISQEVEEALSEVGLTALDFAAFCRDKKVEEIENPETGEITTVDICDENGEPEYDYSLRYEEFIALNTHMIQKLQAENRELKDQLSNLEERLAKLEALCGGDTNGS